MGEGRGEGFSTEDCRVPCNTTGAMAFVWPAVVGQGQQWDGCVEGGGEGAHPIVWLQRGPVASEALPSGASFARFRGRPSITYTVGDRGWVSQWVGWLGRQVVLAKICAPLPRDLLYFSFRQGGGGSLDPPPSPGPPPPPCAVVQLETTLFLSALCKGVTVAEEIGTRDGEVRCHWVPAPFPL